MARNQNIALRPPTLPLRSAEALAAQFYAWERRGRGWQCWPEPVRLDPPFRPFFFHGLPSGPAVDDGRRPGLLGSLVQGLGNLFSGQASRGGEWVSLPAPEQDEEVLPALDPDDDPLVEWQVALPPALKITRETAEGFLIGLTGCRRPLSFELIGLAEETVVQLACRATDRRQLEAQLAAYFPEAVLTEEADFLARRWCAADDAEAVIVDFGLSEEFMLPLKTLRHLDADPLVGLAGALTDLAASEVGVFQVLFEPAGYPWAESIFRAVTDEEGEAFFVDAPQVIPLAREKIARPLYAAVIRVAARSPYSRRAWPIVQGLGGALAALANPNVNELVPLTNDEYADELHAADLLDRRTHRSGMLLNSDELLSVVHLPSASVRSPKLRRETKKTKAAPELATGGRLILGENAHNGKVAPVTLDAVQRLRHMHVIGASGTGKSTFLLNMILQDIECGEGLAVLDPHGDLIDQIIERIPESRWSDVVLLDPSDEEYPIGFNILSAHSELEKQLLASDLVSVFKRLSTSWGDQMSSVLGNGVLAFLESERGGTLAELRRFLVEKDYRERFLETVRDPEVVYYWRKEFPLLSGKPQGPLLTRLDIFLRPKPIRYMVSQKENRLDFAGMMNEGKIFLAKLAQGAIGEENAYLLGTLLVSKFHQLALSRQEMREAGRRDFYLYIDEFHNFVTPSMASILSGARKYHLGLILAHQEMRQLGSRDAEVTGAVLANPYTRVCFRLGDEDAKKLENGFSFFESKDLQNLGTGEAICRMERAEYDFNLKTFPLEPVDEAEAEECRERIIQLSRQRYAVQRDLVEAELARERPMVPPSPAAAPIKTEPPSVQTEMPPVAAQPMTPETVLPEPSATTNTQESGLIPVPAAPIERTKAPARSKSKPTPAEPAMQGRGGQKHKYLQQLIKQWAEGMGWRAEIEKQILAGAGSVDVALSKGQVTVACEISVTTGVEQELGNIDKCLKAGYGYVVAVSAEEKQVEKIKDAYTKRAKGNGAENVRFLTVEEFLAFVESLEAQAAGRESTNRGYKVKVQYRAAEDEEKQVKKQALSQVILNSLKKLKK